MEKKTKYGAGKETQKTLKLPGAEGGRPRAAARRVPLLRAPSNRFPPNRGAATSFRPRSRGAQPALGVPGPQRVLGAGPAGQGAARSSATHGEGTAGTGAHGKGPGGRAAGAGGSAEAFAVAEVEPAALRCGPGLALRSQLLKSRSHQGTCPPWVLTVFQWVFLTFKKLKLVAAGGRGIKACTSI